MGREFAGRWAKFLPGEGWCHIFVAGEDGGDAMEQKTYAAMRWLFGTSFTNICLFLTNTEVCLVASKITGREFEEVLSVRKGPTSSPTLTLFDYEKEENLGDSLRKWIDKRSVTQFRYLTKEKHIGSFAELVVNLLQNMSVLAKARATATPYDILFFML